MLQANQDTIMGVDRRSTSVRFGRFLDDEGVYFVQVEVRKDEDMSRFGLRPMKVITPRFDKALACFNRLIENLRH